MFWPSWACTPICTKGTVCISLLQLLKEIKAPLHAFTCTLSWAAKWGWTSISAGQSTNAGKADPEPFWEVYHERTGITGVIMHVLSLFCFKQPNSFKDLHWHQVIASLLSCPPINQDDNFIIHGQEGHLLQSRMRLSNLDDIDTWYCYYRRTHKSSSKESWHWHKLNNWWGDLATELATKQIGDWLDLTTGKWLIGLIVSLHYHVIPLFGRKHTTSNSTYWTTGQLFDPMTQQLNNLTT